jgi:hypothetical protein
VAPEIQLAVMDIIVFNRNGLSGGDNVAKASDKFGTLNINHSISKNGLYLVLAYSSTFNQSITNSERGILNLILPQLRHLKTVKIKLTQK